MSARPNPSLAGAPVAGAPAAPIRHWPWPLAAAIAAGGVFVWGLARGRLLLYGDATAHLMIARRMVDSRTPGLSQWGSVWLPFPHLLMAPFTLVMACWRSGAAGSVVAIAAFALATWFLHRLAARHFGPGVAHWAALWFLLNPNLLYLAAVPMTEAVYLMAFLGAVDQISLAGADGRQPSPHVLAAALWALAAAMTRYDGWFCLPFFAAAVLFSRTGRGPQWGRAVRFCSVAAIGPMFWFAYNQFYFGDWLSFLRGPYSARQIYLRALRHGGQRYPGDHQLAVAVLYYLKAAALDCGLPLLLLAVLGLAAWFWSRRAAAPVARPHWAPPLLLLLPLPWYLWAMWSGNVPIFVPMYWPHGYYNLRYGVQVLAAAAVFSGLAVASAAQWRGWRFAATWRRPGHQRESVAGPPTSASTAAGWGPSRSPTAGPANAGAPAWSGGAVQNRATEPLSRLQRPSSLLPARALARGVWTLAVLLAAAAYAAMLGGVGPMTYAEAVHNAPARLAMEHQLAAALRPRRPGQTVLMYVGSYPGALPDDGIPLRFVIEESNFRQWDRALAAPQRYVAWVVLQSGSPLAAGLNRAALRRYFRPVARFTAPRQPVITVYRRTSP